MKFSCMRARYAGAAAREEGLHRVCVGTRDGQITASNKMLTASPSEIIAACHVLSGIRVNVGILLRRFL